MATNQIRVVIGSVAERRSKATDEMGKVIGEELRKLQVDVRRHYVVKGQAEHITALINNVAVDNEADVVILVGGTGFGPSDNATEAVRQICEHQIEGFGEAYRRMLREGTGGTYRESDAASLHARTMLVRASAGVYSKCLVFSLGGRVEDVRAAVATLIAPILPDAIELAYGRGAAAK